ncbi:GNAT family N-acetyltransferase [Streptomyces sp900116325]|uniref:GNAT family N-acetyltransferase n=1 Tax=Streptomyces sp. 900116325 TaxID=3154295 RepID=UPI0033AC548C
MYLEYLVIPAGHRGRGYGSQMEWHLSRAMAARGYTRAFLLVKPERADALRLGRPGLAAGC